MDSAKRGKLLIVDDVSSNIRMLMEALKDDYAIVAATGGEKALRLAATEPLPDLILLDVMMPEMDGHEVCRRLKSDPITQAIPVIFVTSLGEEQDETLGLELGAIDYIHKPFNAAIVRARVRNHLELISARNQLKAQNQSLHEAAILREDVERITRHDLKVPLNMVINTPQLMLLKEGLDEDSKRRLHYIMDAGYRMLDMINRSLDLYKMETGSYVLQPEAFNLVSLLFKVIQEYNKEISKIVLHIEINGSEACQTDEFLVVGEQLLCYSMFANLLKNAIEASPPGQPLRIQLQHAEGQAMITIHNYGAVPESIQARFFDKYVTAGKHAGTGLGTYSAALIAKTHHGDISADFSQPDATSVCVRLPQPVNASSARYQQSIEEALQVLPSEGIQTLNKYLEQGNLQKFRSELTALDQQYHLPLLSTLQALGKKFNLQEIRLIMAQLLRHT